MKKPNLIVMLTHNDVTVKNAKEVFEGAKSAPCEYWGFKDTGISPKQMKELVCTMKEAGKKVFLESLAYSREETMRSVKLAVDCKFDYFLGGTYYDTVANYAKENGLNFSPFLGNRHDGKLFGEMDELIEQAKVRDKKDIYGINISAFRYDGDSSKLIEELARSVIKPISIVGSINDYERLKYVKNSGCWTFTIGGAFFENKFGNGFTEQIEKVTEFIQQ